MIAEGFNLMLYGMGTVFVFLTLLVFCTTYMSKFVSNFTAEELSEPISAAATSTTTGVDPRTLAVIKAAVAAHRNS